MEEQEFKGRTALIVGAGSGIGLLAARTLAARGANVVMADVNGEAVAAAAAEITEAGGVASCFVCDVRKFSEVEKTCAFALEKYGAIDILLYTAGGSPGRIFKNSAPFQMRPVELLDWGIDVNLRGALYFSRAVIGSMLERETGVILLLGSVSGVSGSAGAIEYSTAKSGMDGLVKSLGLLGAPHHVRACCVSPGPVLTRTAMNLMQTPMGRAADPREVVDLLLYLASDKAAFITCTNYIIDGGRSTTCENHAKEVIK